jgi:RimJ/RimL family protein N-acetyltransferase
VDLAIVTATHEDAEELRSFASKLFGEHLPGIFRRPVPTLEQEHEFIQSRIEPANSTLLVARLGGDVVGLLDFVGGSLAEETHAGTFGVSVDREHRGQGVGTALIEGLLAWAPEHGIRRIQAWAWANNPGSIALYERLGFVREGTCRRAIVSDGEYVDVVLLARLLDD